MSEEAQGADDSPIRNMSWITIIYHIIITISIVVTVIIYFGKYIKYIRKSNEYNTKNN